MKKMLGVFASLFVCLFLCACGLSDIPLVGRFFDKEPAEPTPTPVPLELNGQWSQENSHSEGNFQGINITDDYIEIYWIFGDDRGAALYWAGTVTPPKKKSVEDSYEWVSRTDTSRTTKSLLTDKSATKTFRYEGGKLSYDVEYEDMTMTVKAQRNIWGFDMLMEQGTVDIFSVVNGVYRDFVATLPTPTPLAEEAESGEEEAPPPA